MRRGALVALGYWNDPERSAERFRPVPATLTELSFEEIAVWSGDTVVKDEDGLARCHGMASLDDSSSDAGSD